MKKALITLAIVLFTMAAQAQTAIWQDCPE
jgi:hypothetical protein